MEKQTAEAWVQFFALTFLITGVTALIAAAAQLLFSPFSPPEDIGRAGMIVVNVISAVFSAGFAALYLLLGAGLWQRRPWARIIMIVLASLGIALGVFIMLFGGILSSIPIPELGVLGPYVGIVFVLLGLFVAGAGGFELWLFLNAAIAGVFAERTGSLVPSLEGMHESIVRAWAIYTWLTAAGIAVLGVVVMVFGPIVMDFAAAVAEIPSWVSQVLVIGGIALVVLALVMAFAGLGLWRLQEWARVLTIVLAWLGGIIMLALGVLIVLGAENVYDGAIAVAQLLGYVIIAGFEIWFFQFNEEAKRLFSLTGQSRTGVKRR